jgi:beta-fructofuranosidase
LDSKELLELRILLDGSVIEIIANKRTSITSRMYPLREDSEQIQVLGKSCLKSLDIFELASIWSL